MPTKKRSHRNDKRRLTAKERATRFAHDYVGHWRPEGVASFALALTRLLGDHARDTLARHKRKHAAAWDRMLAKGATPK